MNRQPSPNSHQHTYLNLLAEKASKGDMDAMERVCKALRYLGDRHKRVYNPRLSFADIDSVVSEAIVYAIRHYDPSRKTNVETIAYITVTNHIYNANNSLYGVNSEKSQMSVRLDMKDSEDKEFQHDIIDSSLSDSLDSVLDNVISKDKLGCLLQRIEAEILPKCTPTETLAWQDYLSHPDDDGADRRKRLGVARSDYFTNIVKNIKHRIRYAMDINDFTQE